MTQFVKVTDIDFDEPLGEVWVNPALVTTVTFDRANDVAIVWYGPDGLTVSVADAMMIVCPLPDDDDEFEFYDDDETVPFFPLGSQDVGIG